MSGKGYGVDYEKIRAYRIRRRLTQQKLAECAGLSVGQISRIEKGIHTPRFSTIDRLAGCLGIDPDTLMSWEEADQELEQTHWLSLYAL